MSRAPGGLVGSGRSITCGDRPADRRQARARNEQPLNARPDDSRTRTVAPSSVAPMMDWTDRHCRYFHRLHHPRHALYTEMVTTGALLHGDVPRHLDFRREHPVALQLGGSEPDELAQCAGSASMGLRRNQPQLRLPERARAARRIRRLPDGRGRAGAPTACGDARRGRDAGDGQASHRHRRVESYDFVRDFVGTVGRRAAATVFIVHARNAWLKGITPKENREMPPLRYDNVDRAEARFPGAEIVINGGVTATTDRARIWRSRRRDARARRLSPSLAHGGMGRALLRRRPSSSATRDAVEARWSATWSGCVDAGAWSHASRHMLGLRNGGPGARRWRQVWSRCLASRASAPARSRASRVRRSAGRRSRAPRPRRPRRRGRRRQARARTPTACAVVNASPKKSDADRGSGHRQKDGEDAGRGGAARACSPVIQSHTVRTLAAIE